MSILSKMVPLRLTPFSIALTYTLLGGVWIFFSDHLLSEFLNDPESLIRAKILNEWIFIVASTQILYVMIRRRELAIEASQASLCRVNRALKVFSECNKVLAWDPDEASMLRRICRIFVEVGGYRLAWVGFARHDGDKSVEPVAQWGDEYGYLKKLRVTWDESDFGQGPAGTAIRTGKTAIVQEIDSHPAFHPWRAAAQRHGYASAIALPLRNDQQIFGALVILAAETAAFNLEEIRLLEELSSDLSHGINSVRLRAEQTVMKQERRLLATVIEQAAEGVLICDAVGTIHYVNSAFEMICGLTPGMTVNTSIHQLGCITDNLSYYQALQETIASGIPHRGRFAHRRPNGTPYEVDANISLVRSQAEAEARYVVVMRDFTHEAELESQLRIAQKMEAIATLAGGIAHDFNNILAAIVTNTELSLDDLSPESPLRESLEIVFKAGQRGRELVRQIMTLSRQGAPERRPVQVEQIVVECLALLRASLPATIEIRKAFVPTARPVAGDPSQIHQVIMNLCTNAADAMAEGGGVLEVTLEETRCPGDAAPLGSSVQTCLKLTVSDSGPGMGPSVLERIYDPFFTTKGHGKGTGLGLSVVHGIVRGHAGALRVASSPGCGTSFEVFLPQISGSEIAVRPVPLAINRGGSERILLVDDEPELVTAGRKVLERLGYQVVGCTDSRETLKLFSADPQRFDLLITDQTMPHLTGEMLAREVLKIRADLPIILCSGLGANDGRFPLERMQALGIRELLAKPYERQELSSAIRRLLD